MHNTMISKAALHFRFDNFNFLRQGALLALDTFGISHILPIFGLPILFFYEYSGEKQASSSLFGSLTQVNSIDMIYFIVIEDDDIA